MDNKPFQFKQALLWLLPTGIEIAVYIFITGVTFVLSSLELVRNALYVTGDFNPIRAAIASIDTLLQNFVGERIAGSLSLAIFWGSVGLLVNIIWWLGSNFSTELSNDLVFSKYVHPKDSDPSSHFKLFIQRTVIRAGIAILAILYLNFFMRQALPHISTNFAQIISEWNERKLIVSALLNIIAEIIMLHIFVILARLILLKKQVFN